MTRVHLSALNQGLGLLYKLHSGAVTTALRCIYYIIYLSVYITKYTSTRARARRSVARKVYE